MKRYLLIAVSVVMFTSSCKKGEETVLTDEEAIQTLIGSSIFFQQYSATGEPDTSAMNMILGPITPVFWFRSGKTYPEPDMTIHIVDDSAYVDFTGFVEGILNIWDGSTWPWEKYEKDFADQAQIKGIFKRTGDPDNSDRGWELWGVTGILAHSYDIPSFSIDSFEVYFNSTKVMTMSDPFSWFVLTELDTATTSDTISMRLFTSADSGSISPYFHFYNQEEHYRSYMEKDSTGAYVPSIKRMPAKIGYHWIVADILSYNTLHDSDSAYSSLLWFALFYVK